MGDKRLHSSTLLCGWKDRNSKNTVSFHEHVLTSECFSWNCWTILLVADINVIFYFLKAPIVGVTEISSSKTRGGLLCVNVKVVCGSRVFVVVDGCGEQWRHHLQLCQPVLSRHETDD